MLFKNYRSLCENKLNRVSITADMVAVLVVQAAFWIGVLRHIELPGLYMDAVNPDYLAAQTLNPGLPNPFWTLPTVWFPILGNLYHGVQNYYLDLPIFWFLGTNIVALRLAQASFGSIIVLLLYFVSIRATGNRLISFFAALALATDIAFLASFRTQFFIILGGEAWLFAALLCLFLRNPTNGVSGRRYLLSGAFFGLAVYGYFVFLFFLPAFILLVSLSHRANSWIGVKYWIAGFCIGMFPYVIGYVSVILALGGVSQTIEWLTKAVTGIAPLSSKLSYIDSFEITLRNAKLALNNIGNEMMIFGGEYNDVYWTSVKIAFFLIVILLGIALAARRQRVSDLRENPLGLWLFILPISYVIIAATLGDRLWVHHFSVLVPMAYLVSAVGINLVCQAMQGWNYKTVFLWQRKLIIIFGSLFIFFNFYQQQVFFSRLDKTGGAGKASSALTVMAEDALSAQSNAVYFFPDWGFFMSFNLLTGNRIPYVLELNPELVEKYSAQNREIHVAFWNRSDSDKYAGLLKSAHSNKDVLFQTYYQRDGNPSFYMMSSRPSNAVSARDKTAQVNQKQTSTSSPATELKIGNWGPQSAKIGTTPNEQPDGSMGIWIKAINTEALGEAQVIFGGQAAKQTSVQEKLITAAISTEQLSQPGNKEVVIKQISTGKIYKVGIFIVEPEK